MLKLINPDKFPIGGIRFIDPDTGFRYDNQYTSFDALQAHVNEYRSQNKLSQIENFREVWENWVCQEGNMDKQCCPVSAHIARKFHHYWNAGRLLVRTALKKGSERFVRQEIADSRAKTCLDCKCNLFRTGHKHAGFYASKWVTSQTAGRSTPYDDRLFTCSVCTCILKAKVHYRSGEIVKSLSALEAARLRTEPKSISGKPLKCWQADAIEKQKKGESDGSEKESEKGTSKEERKEG